MQKGESHRGWRGQKSFQLCPRPSSPCWALAGSSVTHLDWRRVVMPGAVRKLLSRCGLRAGPWLLPDVAFPSARRRAQARASMPGPGELHACRRQAPGGRVARPEPTWEIQSMQ